MPKKIGPELRDRAVGLVVEHQHSSRPHRVGARGGENRGIVSRGRAATVGCVEQRFSVIIPTLQRSDRLGPLVEMYCAHRLVGEVIVINNAPAPLTFIDPKVRVLQQEQNICVNPAWNLGASVAREPLLIISNDDIAFHPRVIDAAARMLRLPVGVIGPNPGVLDRRVDGRPWFMPTYRRSSGFGTLMFLRAEDYVPIPADLLIWSGDHWLFHHQTKRNLFLKGAWVDTRRSATASHPEFMRQKRADRAKYFAEYHSDGYSRRFWLGTRVHAGTRFARLAVVHLLRGNVRIRFSPRVR